MCGYKMVDAGDRLIVEIHDKQIAGAVYALLYSWKGANFPKLLPTLISDLRGWSTLEERAALERTAARRRPRGDRKPKRVSSSREAEKALRAVL